MADYDLIYGSMSNTLIRIAVALERTANATENIESHQLNIRNDIHHLRILGDHNGSGIRITNPYGWITNAYYYKWFIDEGHILDDTYRVSSEQIANSISYINTYMGEIGNNFPGVYSYGGADTDEQPLQSPPN